MRREGSVAHDGIVRQTFDTIAATRTVTSLRELNNLFRPAIAEIGFALFAGIELFEPSCNMRLRMLFGEGLEPWCSHYEEMHYATDDLVISESLKRFEPFYWSDLISRGGLSPRAVTIFRDAESFGLHDGFVVPLHTPGGHSFIVLLAGASHDPADVHSQAAAHLLATYYGLIGRKIHFSGRNERSPEDYLTKRQSECLRWARAGKSSTDIAEILRISAGVVDEHIAGACKRLGVRTRVQAVIAAADRGYLDG